MKIVRRFPYSSYSFALSSSSISEAWIDFASSLRRLENVIIVKKLDDDALRLFQKLVTGRKLSSLMMLAEVCGSMEVIKTLLCQDQFKNLPIWNNFEDWNGAAVGELLQFWSENSEELRGKSLILGNNCKGGVEQLEQFVLRRASPTATEDLGKVLKVCSTEECNFINRVFHHDNITYVKSPYVYKYEDAREGNARSLYVSFKCPTQEERRNMPRFPAGYDGYDDLSVMRYTTCLQIFFC
uniref:FBA_2 domain-containing protein n=1 Tax=Steinernema glaseri TaxID=37863 RepID=A0A1I8AK05_9BILA